MVIAKEILSDFKELYEKAMQLVNEESQHDSPSDPYRSYYSAGESLQLMKKNLTDAVASVLAEEADDSEDYITYKSLLAFACFYLGRVYVFTDEITNGEKLYKETMDNIENYKLKPSAVIVYINSANELSTLYGNRKEYQNANDLLNKAEEAYKVFKSNNVDALDITDIFDPPEEKEVNKGKKELERVHTLTLYYLAQVYGYLGEMEKSAKYCHMTLQRQLADNSYEPIDFALNASTLSQYFIGQDMFSEARHHLALASHIMANYKTKMISPDMSEEKRAEVTETYNHRYADVARCWAKYGLNLLETSKDRLYEEDNINKGLKKLQIDLNTYRFPDIDISSYENSISADYCLTFDDAKPIFHFVSNHLDEAKEYYKPDTEATEYAKIIKDYADLYRLIAFFEEDPINQSKMQKRRAKYYEDLLELLNPVFYMSICRECWYGAGLAYCSILDIKLDALHEMKSPPSQDIQKVNQVCQKAINHYQSFIKTYMDKDGTSIKPNLDTEEQRTVLYAFFHLGRLYFKIITSDLRQQLENMNNSLKYYKMFTEECANRKEAAEFLKGEIGVCSDMVRLLPLRIASIQSRLCD